METHDFIGTIQRDINPQFKCWSGNIVKRDIMKKNLYIKRNFKFFFCKF